MKAAVFYGKNDLRVEERDMPEIGRNDVLVRVHACGICGTDVHIFCGDEGAAPTPENTVLGHEFAGEVVKVGADVPYCIMGGTALSEGIGEILTKLPAVLPAHVLIAKPDLDVSTAFVYKNLKVSELEFHPDIDGMRMAIEGHDLKGVTDRMGNVLETVTIPAYPIIGDMKKTCMENGAVNALMSGSGPTVFAIFDDLKKAELAADVIREKYQIEEVYVTGFWG